MALKPAAPVQPPVASLAKLTEQLAGSLAGEGSMKTYTAPTHADHLRMMQSEDDWPAWPLLPLKHEYRKDPDMPGMPATAFLASGCGALLFHGTIFFGCQGATSREQFDSFEAILADGWIVD